MFLDVKDGLLSDYYWTSAKCAFSYAKELGVPNMVCQGILSVELTSGRCIFLFLISFKVLCQFYGLPENKENCA